MYGELLILKSLRAFAEKVTPSAKKKIIGRVMRPCTFRRRSTFCLQEDFWGNRTRPFRPERGREFCCSP